MVYTFGPQDKDPNKEETESEKEKKSVHQRGLGLPTKENLQDCDKCFIINDQTKTQEVA